MAGNTSRQNGKKGGRPVGAVSEDTRIRQEAMAEYRRRGCAMISELFEAQRELIIGVTVQEPDGKDGVRIYQRPPDRGAISDMVDRLGGKPAQSVEITGSETSPLRIVHEFVTVKPKAEEQAN